MREKIDFEKWNDDNDKMKVVILTQRNYFELLNYFISLYIQMNIEII